MNKVTIRVPATTANLGPGYDCLGVALQLYNRVSVARSEVPDPQPMAAVVAEQFFAVAAVEPFAFTCSIAGDVPRSRGLGSSVTVRLGLLHGLNDLAGRPLEAHRLFQVCAELEGHPDNAAPGAFGGFTVAGGAEVARFAVTPALRFVLLVPDFEISTPAARRVLPAQLDRVAAVQSCANACRITAAFATQNYEMLRGAFADSLHQPYRERELIPFLSRVIAAGEEAGALGGFLSGSGSTICCLTLDNAASVGMAMLAAAASPGARTIITSADNFGVSRKKIAMRRWLEAFEEFAIDVILERRYGKRAALLRWLLHALSWLFRGGVQTRLWLFRHRFCGNIIRHAWSSRLGI